MNSGPAKVSRPHASTLCKHNSIDSFQAVGDKVDDKKEKKGKIKVNYKSIINHSFLVYKQGEVTSLEPVMRSLPIVVERRGWQGQRDIKMSQIAPGKKGDSTC